MNRNNRRTPKLEDRQSVGNQMMLTAVALAAIVVVIYFVFFREAPIRPADPAQNTSPQAVAENRGKLLVPQIKNINANTERRAREMENIINSR